MPALSERDTMAGLSERVSMAGLSERVADFFNDAVEFVEDDAALLTAADISERMKIRAPLLYAEMKKGSSSGAKSGFVADHLAAWSRRDMQSQVRRGTKTFSNVFLGLK